MYRFQTLYIHIRIKRMISCVKNLEHYLNLNIQLFIQQLSNIHTLPRQNADMYSDCETTYYHTLITLLTKQ